MPARICNLVILSLLGALAAAWPARSHAADPATDKSDEAAAEHERRFAALKPDDLDGHFQLALWCKDREAYTLLRQQSDYVLSLNPNHEEAKLLRQLALRQTGDPQAAEGPAAGTKVQGGAGQTRLPRPLTEEEIQRIRWLEFDDQGEPRPLAVQFLNNVVERFLAAVEGRVGFTTDEERRQFNILKPHEKVALIRQETQDRFAVDIVLKSDPRRLADFERRVWPVVLGGCATSGCHGGATQNPFALYTDAVLSKQKVFTNYLILHDYRVGDKLLIDRNTPDRSLLLTYGLVELSANLEPGYKHPTPIKPFYRGPNDPRYRTIYEWIDSLSALPPDYGVSFAPAPAGP